ncbi:ComF family protein [Aliishimia ponticola]|uniref:ComF family protein n=2 Tax=Aliishimia ponticola TaxID=2499833 RepID=A0A4V3XJW6_9RHOB|nr:ComF family protein [Aliishimia ponticola]
MVESEFALCGACWAKLPLISGPVCQSCGVPVLSRDPEDDTKCDDCQKLARPWSQGRSAMLYRDMGRTLVLRLKHADRHDVAVTAATWLAQAARPLLQEDTVIVPVPLHWQRLVQRRYNQSALLAQHLALRVSRRAVLDGLVRMRRTKPLDGANVTERFERLSGVIIPNSQRTKYLTGKPVLLVDDVMTSGATLAAATEGCLAAGARRVDVLTLARVAKDD